MNILHISNYYNPHIGGIEKVCEDLVANDSINQTAVVCFNSNNKNIVDIINGHSIYRVGILFTLFKQAFSLSYFRILKRSIKEFRPDIIHFYWANPFPAFVLLFVIPKNIKLVVHWHMDIIKQKKIYPLVKPIETALLKRADLVVVTSPSYKECSVPLQNFQSKVKILPNAIRIDNLNLQDGDEDRILRIKNTYGQRKIVFFVGRHVLYKGLSYLLDAEKEVSSNCVFVIAGNGPLTKELQTKYKSNRVFFIGKISDDDLRCYYHASTVFAFPSITKNEAFGLTLAESMYCGTPAVTFTIPGSGVNWVSLNGETGIEVPNGDTNEYAKAIDRLLSDEQLRLRLATNGIERVKKLFTIPTMVNTMNTYYSEII